MKKYQKAKIIRITIYNQIGIASLDNMGIQKDYPHKIGSNWHSCFRNLAQWFQKFGLLVSEICPIGFRNLAHWFQKFSPVVSEIWPSRFRNLAHWFQKYCPVVSDILCSGFRYLVQWFQKFDPVVSDILCSGFINLAQLCSTIWSCGVKEDKSFYSIHNLWLLHMT